MPVAFLCAKLSSRNGTDVLRTGHRKTAAAPVPAFFFFPKAMKESMRASNRVASDASIGHSPWGYRSHGCNFSVCKVIVGYITWMCVTKFPSLPPRVFVVVPCPPSARWVNDVCVCAGFFLPVWQIYKRPNKSNIELSACSMFDVRLFQKLRRTHPKQTLSLVHPVFL